MADEKQSFDTISGTVVDNQLYPLPNAIVVARSKGKVIGIFKTDPSGNFSSTLPVETFILEASYPGYEPSSQTTNVPQKAKSFLVLTPFSAKQGAKGGGRLGGGANTNVISGYVVDPQNKPLKGIQVRILGHAKKKDFEKYKRARRSFFSRLKSLFAQETDQENEEEERFTITITTNRSGFFSSKTSLPNGSYIIQPVDPSGRFRFFNRILGLSGKVVPPLHFKGYEKRTIEEKKEKQPQKSPEQKALGKPQRLPQVVQQRIDQIRLWLRNRFRKPELAQPRPPQIEAPKPKEFTAIIQRGEEIPFAKEELLVRTTTPVRPPPPSRVRPIISRIPPTRIAGIPRLAPAGARAGIQGAIQAGQLAVRGIATVAQGVTTLTGAVVSTPIGWIIILVVGIVIALTIIILLLRPSGIPSQEESTTSGPIRGGTVPGGGGSGGQISKGLNYYIPFRDPTVVPLDIKSTILASWTNAQIGNWDIIVSKAIANNWNPAMLLALWIEESGAQGVPTDDPLGCLAPSNIGKNDINLSLQCVFTSFGSLTNDRFADFMCRYSDGHDAPCTFAKNPNFPPNIRNWYEKLVPAGSYGALVEIKQLLPSLTATCPIAGGTAATLTCGSFFTLRSGCGHCRADAGYGPYMSNCTYPEINYAEDIDGPSGQDVILPSINGQAIDWILIRQNLSSVGWIRYFSGINRKTNEEYWIQFHHVDANYGTTSGISGDVGARICTTSSNCNHVHVEFSTVTTGGRTPQDAPLFLCI